MNAQPQKKNVVLVVATWIYNNLFLLPLELLAWCILASIDSVVLLFSKENAFHRNVRKYYQEKVKTRLTNRPLSRTSFSTTHGFLYSIIVVGIILWVISQFSPSPKIIKTKHITVTATSETHDTIDFFNMFMLPVWSYQNDSLGQWFHIKFFTSPNMKSDTAKFCIRFETNFDTEFHPEYKEIVKDSICKDKQWTYMLESDEGERQFTFLSDASILNDPETPYVNLYLEFNQAPSDNALMPLFEKTMTTDSVALKDLEDKILGHIGLWIKLGETINEGVKSDADILPYDLITVKPEPTTNDPFHFNYNTPEKYFEVLNKGIYISVVNRDLEAQLERKAFLHTVLIGAFISLVFTLILALLDRWKEINEKEGKQDPFD